MKDKLKRNVGIEVGKIKGPITRRKSKQLHTSEVEIHTPK